MTKEYSPFTPGVPVPYEFFVGRIKEVEEFIHKVQKSHDVKSIERLFVTGERGIGKSSLCNVALKIAEMRMDVLGLHVYLGGVTTMEEMVRRIFERLLKESVGKSWFESLKKLLGDHIKQVGFFDFSIEFDASDKSLEKAVNDFVPALRNLLKHLENYKSSILLVLDDINGLAVSEKFANWLKSLVDEIATGREPLPLTIVLVGIPERRRQLINSQPSLDRVFDIIEICSFNQDETREFFEKAFNEVNVKVSDEAHFLLWRYSQGYPVFIHEIGDAVFKEDKDNYISDDDAAIGIFAATEIIGKKYIEPKVLDVIRSQRYRKILKKLPKGPISNQFSRKDIAERLSNDEAKVFNNFLRRMDELNVIRKIKESDPVSYEFTSALYYLFFWLQESGISKKSNH
jgi:hypothetical protein